jgi:hypothetical protein
MTMRRVHGILASLALLLSTATAVAEESMEPAAALERGRSLIRSFDYPGAVRLLERVVSSEAASAGQRCQALELIGAAELIRRRQTQARQAFEHLLTLDPGHEMADPEIPPRVVSFFDRLRESFEPQVNVTLEVDAPAVVPDDGTIVVEATTGGETTGIEQVVVLARTAPDQPFREVETVREGRVFTAEVDQPEVTTPVELHVEARAPSGHVLARAGTADAPLRVEPGLAPEPEPVAEPVAVVEDHDPRRPWYRTWWFWTIVGAVAAGGITTTVVLTVPDEEQRNGTFGSVQMP